MGALETKCIFSELSIMQYSDYVCGCPCVKQIMLKCFHPYQHRLFDNPCFCPIYSSILPSKIKFCIRYSRRLVVFQPRRASRSSRTSRSEMRYKTNPDSQGGNHPETSKNFKMHQREKKLKRRVPKYIFITDESNHLFFQSKTKVKKYV